MRKKTRKKGFPELEMKSISIHSGEIVAPDSVITAVFSDPVDPKSAQGGFRMVPDVRGNVRFSADRTEATWTSASPMVPGSYTLLIGDITDKNRSKTVRNRVIPFVVSGGLGRFPKTRSNHIVLGMSKAKLPLSRQQFSLAKILDPTSKKIYQVAVDEKGNKIDFDDVLKQDQKKYFEKYGKIHPTLHEEIEKRGEKAKIPGCDLASGSG